MSRRERKTMTEELFEELLERLESGESLIQICEKSGEFPGRAAVRRYIDADEERRSRYARAREEQAAYFAEEILKVARNATNDSWGRDRLLVDALKWSASKQAPRVYGEKTTHTVEGEVGLDVRIVAARKRANGDES